MRDVNFDDVVTAVDQLIDEEKSFTSKDVTDIIRSQNIHALNKTVGKMLRDNWGYLSHGTSYQRTSVEVEPGVTAILYHPANEGLQDAVDEFVSRNEMYSLQCILEELGLEDAPYEERSRISDWLRRHIPDGYSKMRNGTINAYTPDNATPTVVFSGKTISKEDAEKIINDTIEQFDAIMNSVVTGFNKQIADMHNAFESLFK